MRPGSALAGTHRGDRVDPPHPRHFQRQEDTLAAARTATPEPNQLDRLAAEFPGGDVKTRSQAGQTLTYISIDATIRRLNDVLGANWSVERASTKVELLASGQYMALTELYLSAVVDGVPTSRYGVGAMVNKDPDMAAKTALAEALKKAGHALGVALYLWDADGRKRAETRMKLDKNRDSEATLKTAVFELAKTKNGGVKPASAAEVAKLLGIKPGALADKATLIEILEAEGVL